ncbi:hypothetical protein I6M49_21795 [Shewanella algae]|uniref:hypothetical protein n=1 Tax=Shewanella algae TaxID=38313 RepID=UPI001AAD2E6F|nr:hypothetical protein [Shewanella algae]MBO2656080.1 hypothetical protein [Shewanella algae]
MSGTVKRLIIIITLQQFVGRRGRYIQEPLHYGGKLVIGPQVTTFKFAVQSYSALNESTSI